jgi:uncharacterized membrane protein
MLLLLLGLLLWVAAHLFRRVAPGTRARLGNPAKGVVALLLVLALLLMIWGYKAWTGPILWVAPDWARHVNNLLMVVAVYLYASSFLGTWAARVAGGHPQLVAVVIWSVAHLLVNGDAASLLLFGGLGAWAVAEIALIGWPVPVRAPRAAWREAVTLAATPVAVALIAWVHAAQGYQVFG